VVTPERIRVIVADDERPARAYLTTLLQRRPDTDLVGEAETGVEAVSLIERERPDLAFLDLQMPELDGLGVVRVLKRRHVPLVVFVTAYEEYALRAFELNAVDYLLKPVNPARLGDAVARAHERLDRADLRAGEVDRVRAAVDAYEEEARLPWLERIHRLRASSPNASCCTSRPSKATRTRSPTVSRISNRVSILRGSCGSVEERSRRSTSSRRCI
jgi:DNA-binding LytR/AlgR family response regulator